MEQNMRLLGYALETKDGCLLVWKSIPAPNPGWYKQNGMDLPFLFTPKQESFARDLANNGTLNHSFGKVKVVEIFARNSS